jgi:hypothetical protein
LAGLGIRLRDSPVSRCPAVADADSYTHIVSDMLFIPFEPLFFFFLNVALEESGQLVRIISVTVHPINIAAWHIASILGLKSSFGGFEVSQLRFRLVLEEFKKTFDIAAGLF